MRHLNGGESPTNYFDGGPLVAGYTSRGAQLLQSVMRRQTGPVIGAIEEIPLASHRPSPLSQLPAYTEAEVEAALSTLEEQEQE